MSADSHMHMHTHTFFFFLKKKKKKERTQERWLAFHLDYLKIPNRRTSPVVLIAQLEALLNVAKQMDFVGRKTNEIKVLEETFEIVRNLATSGKGRPVKRTCYMLMCYVRTCIYIYMHIHNTYMYMYICMCLLIVAIMLRGPSSMYEKLPNFLESHVLKHLDDLDKAGDSLKMLVLLFEGTNNPFPFHERRPINWKTYVRVDDNETARKDHMQIVFRAFMRGKTLKNLYHRHWRLCIRVFVHLCAQQLDFAITTLLPQLFDIKKSSTEQIVLGLDVISEMMRRGGDFVRQHQPSPDLLSTANDFLPAMLRQVEQLIGVEKLGRRKEALILNDRLGDDEFMHLTLFKEFHCNHAVNDNNNNNSNNSNNNNNNNKNNGNENDHTSAHDHNHNEENWSIPTPSWETMHHLVLTQENLPTKLLASQAHEHEDEKLVAEHSLQEKKREELMLNDSAYVSLTNKDLLKISFVKDDKLAKQILMVRQRHANEAALEEMIKKAKVSNRREYMQVLKACLRTALSLRSELILCEVKQGNKLYIGNLLLHPDYEIVELAISVLIHVSKEETYVFLLVSLLLVNTHTQNCFDL
ncbi:hypothetical protein RFI_12706 [Reticulomyxa filosa]|uniref:Uncharacterized protein n=1 Tax=Reticulomyxa filosa TaxID=46433 RepID=X6NEX9_RETFI|nr:hypothetical protein RFI_12706 [Reticulomyxa filosa]|eukprot:ETO24453.1 hypothetical protein RFI_12706 [Reticulomyxa filosa]